MSAPVDYPGQPGLQVLQYFLTAQQLLSNTTRAAVQNLVGMFPTYQVPIDCTAGAPLPRLI